MIDTSELGIDIFNDEEYKISPIDYFELYMFKCEAWLFLRKSNLCVIVSFSEKQDRLHVLDVNFFEQIVRDSFQYKRKNLRNNLKKYDLDIISNVLSKYGEDLNVRAEALEVDVFVDIANALYDK